MIQTVQTYIRYNYNNTKRLVAQSYAYSGGEDFVFLARHGIEWIKNNALHMNFNDTSLKNKGYILIMKRAFDPQLRGWDILTDDLISYSGDNNDFIFKKQRCTEGKLFIDIVDNDTIRYAFLDNDCNTDNIMSAKNYLLWSRPDCTIENDTRNAVDYIRTNAELMTAENLKEILEYDYEKTETRSPR